MKIAQKRLGASKGRERRVRLVFTAFLAVFLSLSGTLFLFLEWQEAASGPQVYGYKIVNIYPHDPSAFTQGLIYEGGYLYEGTGLYGKSTLRKVELKTGKVTKLLPLSPGYFGEGLTSWKGDLIQLTWREGKGFVYEKESFRLVREFSYPTEGWGITHDDTHLIMSDGSPSLYFLDPGTFIQVRRMEVRDRGTPLSGLNELEYVKGKIYANIWPSERIAIISPQTGRVEGWIDLTGLSGSMGHSPKIDVLNGIAYDRDKDRLFITGKLWPKLFEIKLIPVKP
ncbi:MAG TPA: glutaminyl-peptide cyclotransferase [Thermodesulfovibrionales bacterium]|nr:glutaminyl-peptide cyclotransferase [Thermodesulfovibrionales bacterium]